MLKRLALLLVILFVFVGHAYAMMFVQGKGAGITCDIDLDSLQEQCNDENNTTTTAAVIATECFATQLKTSFTMTELQVFIKDQDQAGNLIIRVEGDSSGPDGALVDGNATVTIGNADIGGPSTHTFTFPGSFDVTAGDWIVFKTDSGQFYLKRSSSLCTSGYATYNDASCDGSWTPEGSFGDDAIQVDSFGCSP